jgi:hypothetical protein
MVAARESIANAFARRMNSVINFVELDNRVISATYRNLMVRAKVVLVDKASGVALAEPVTAITSTMPNGSLRIRLPEAIFPPGAQYAWRGHGPQRRIQRRLTN